MILITFCYEDSILCFRSRLTLPVAAQEFDRALEKEIKTPSSNHSSAKSITSQTAAELYQIIA